MSTTAAQPIKATDALGGILRAEQMSVFHFMAEAEAYINPALAEIRRPLEKMVRASRRREGELAAMIVELGGALRQPALAAETQYLAFLSVGFLLPKMVMARQQVIGRYEQAVGSLAGAPVDAIALLKGHLEELKEELAVLQKAAKVPQGV
jgi:hypothetical protein